MRTFARKERIVLGVAVATLAANAILTTGHLDRLVEGQRESRQSDLVLTELARVEATLGSAEAAQRRFLLARGATSLAPLEAGRTVLAIQLDRLAELTRGDDGQAERVARLSLAARRQLALLNDGVRLYRQAGTEEPPREDPAESENAAAVRDALDGLEASERRTLAAREAATARSRFAAGAAAFASTLLGFCLVLVGLLLLRRELVADAAATAALEEANAALRDADRRKDEFLASLAHELRNPLAAMRNAVELLDAPEEGGDGRARERRGLARSVLRRQLAHLTHLVDDLLDLSRVTSSRLVLKKEAVALAEIVEAALETTRPALEARRHELSVAFPRESVLVEGDPVRLAQVVSNLLSNAAKYSPPGGRIELAVAADEVEAVVRVTDDGIGLAPRDLERVFGLFEQGSARPVDAEGLGVGLALSRRLAQLHGGSLTATSAGPGHGSTFTLRIPRASAPEREAAPTAPPPAPSPACRVLLVEDNADGARSLAELLSLDGHEVHVASDGPSGLEAARELLPDAVVLDVGLPGFDGYELARRLRAEPPLANVLLIALSGWAGRDDRTRSLEAGIDHHLVKPAGVSRLAELLATVTTRPRT
ncbi:MAG: ATP-binding protein [Thermoanaerobaculia bacterium]|jgi:signal transduction histidine kinase/CheY-like chemotaxis protein|nr:ATP-binding protein [Thermoanaerobaculia bacterium]